MTKVLILAEGQTEETFIRDVLSPYLASRNVYPVATLAKTKRVTSGLDFKGGIVSYGKLRNDINRLLYDTSAKLVTTMVDFFGLPSDFPGFAQMPSGTCFDQVEYLEKEFVKNINNNKFHPYLALHEFEAMLFAEPEQIARSIPDSGATENLLAINNQFKSPEEIDDKLPPSKRIKDLIPEYRKPLYGPLISQEIGLDSIRKECSHFHAWVSKLEQLSDR